MNVTVKLFQVLDPVAFDVRGVAIPNVRTLEAFGVSGESEDRAKDAARKKLAEMHFKVRGLSWGPNTDDPKGPPQLIAYVSAEGKSP